MHHASKSTMTFSPVKSIYVPFEGDHGGLMASKYCEFKLCDSTVLLEGPDLWCNVVMVV
jgi:hypothetical protein